MDQSLIKLWNDNKIDNFYYWHDIDNNSNNDNTKMMSINHSEIDVFRAAIYCFKNTAINYTDILHWLIYLHYHINI